MLNPVRVNKKTWRVLEELALTKQCELALYMTRQATPVRERYEELNDGRSLSDRVTRQRLC